MSKDFCCECCQTIDSCVCIANTSEHWSEDTWELYNDTSDISIGIINQKSCAEHIVKCVNEYDALVAEVEMLKKYIREYGYCGYHGTRYSTWNSDCVKCLDTEYCERYRIIKESDKG